MWVRKSGAELDEEKRVWSRKRLNPIRPLLLVFSLASFASLSRLAGCRDSFYSDPVPLHEWPRTIRENLRVTRELERGETMTAFGLDVNFKFGTPTLQYIKEKGAPRSALQNLFYGVWR
jgi:hypothetical protein